MDIKKVFANSGCDYEKAVKKFPDFLQLCQSYPGILKFVDLYEDNKIAVALFHKVSSADKDYEKGVEVVVWQDGQVRSDYYWFERNSQEKGLEQRPWHKFVQAKIKKTKQGFKVVLEARKKTSIYYKQRRA